MPEMPMPITPRPVRQLMPSLAISAEGMSVQQKFLEVISANIANAETTRTPEGVAYRREIAVVHTDTKTGANVLDVVADKQRGRLVYDPGHPDANEDGFVEYPNVDTN